MAFRKICQNGSLNPYKNPVFPPFRLIGRKYGILMKEYFDIKKAFDTSLGQTDTKPKPLSLWQETNGQQKAKITFFRQRNLAWKKEANRKNKTEKRGFPSRHSPFLCHLRRPRKSISAKQKIAFSRTIYRSAEKNTRICRIYAIILYLYRINIQKKDLKSPFSLILEIRGFRKNCLFDSLKSFKTYKCKSL